jgi:hypothetical protein
MPGSPDKSESNVKYPDLMRARELYVVLLKDSSPLVNLGYVGSQISRAKNVLSLLEEPGEVMEHLKDDPYISISQEGHSTEQGLEIYHLPDRHGFLLTAYQESRGLSVMQMIFADHKDSIFADGSSEVAYIALMKPGVDLTNLQTLVPEITYGLTYTEAPLGVQKETVLTRPLQKAGLVGTYQAAWVDDKEKDEFVVTINVPENEGKPIWEAFRKLLPVSDENGSMTPFGRKPNVNKDKVMKIFQEQKGRVFSGVLAPEGMGQRK